MLHSSEDSPKTDASPSPPMASLVLAAACNRATKVRGRLKRAQSERTYDLPINLHNNHNNNNYRPLLENDSRLVARKKIQDQSYKNIYSFNLLNTKQKILVENVHIT